MADSFTFTVPMSPAAFSLACLRLAAPALNLLQEIAAVSGTTTTELLDRFATGIQSEETAVPMLKDALTHAAEQLAAMQADAKATHDALDAETAESDAAKAEIEATKARLADLVSRFEPVVTQVQTLAQQGQAAPEPTPAPETSAEPTPAPTPDAPSGETPVSPVDTAPVEPAPVTEPAPATDVAAGGAAPVVAPPADGAEPAPAV